MAEPALHAADGLYRQILAHERKLLKGKVIPEEKIAQRLIEDLTKGEIRNTQARVKQLRQRHQATIEAYLRKHVNDLETSNPAHHAFLNSMPNQEEFLEEVRQAAHIRSIVYSRRNKNYLTTLGKAVGNVLRQKVKERMVAQRVEPLPRDAAPRNTAFAHATLILKGLGVDHKAIVAAVNEPEKYGLEPRHVELLSQVFFPKGTPRTFHQLAGERGMTADQMRESMRRLLQRIAVIDQQKK